MFSLQNKRRLVKKSANLNKYGPFFIIFPLPIMLKFTVHINAVHLFTCVAKAVTSRRSREKNLKGIIQITINLGVHAHFKRYTGISRLYEWKNIFLTRQITTQQRGAAMAFIPEARENI